MEELEQYRQQILAQLNQSVVEQNDIETDPEIDRLNQEIIRLQQDLAKLNQEKADIQSRKADELGEEEINEDSTEEKFTFFVSGQVINVDTINNTATWYVDPMDYSKKAPTEEQVLDGLNKELNKDCVIVDKKQKNTQRGRHGVWYTITFDECSNESSYDELEEGDSDLRVGTAQGMLSKIPQEKVAEIIKNLSPEEYQKFAGGLQSEALHAIFNNQTGDSEVAPSPEGDIAPEGDEEGSGEPDLASLL